MAKVIAVLAVIIMLFGLTTCSNDNSYLYGYLAVNQNKENQDIIQQGDFIFPLVDRYTFTNDYGVYSDGSGSHYGVDLHTTIGNKALSVSKGEVIEAVNIARDNPLPSHYDTPPFVSDGARGNYVTIKTEYQNQVIYFRYMHFKLNSIIVKVGDIVEAGQQIAEVGNSGLTWGAHLHFEVRTGLGASSTDTVDPKQYMYFGELGGSYDPKDLQQKN